MKFPIVVLNFVTLVKVTFNRPEFQLNCWHEFYQSNYTMETCDLSNILCRQLEKRHVSLPFGNFGTPYCLQNLADGQVKSPA